MNIDKSKPVLVTGASGYVAGQIVKKLLDEEFTIHATVRNIADKKKTEYLIELANKSKGLLKLFEADLLENNSFDAAMKGCEIVFHTASPFILNVKNPRKDLIEPAVNGTKNVLSSVNRSPDVKRVVLTSSVAAMYGDNADLHNFPDQTINEKMWNTTSGEKHQPYSYSKLLAEKEAWNIHDAQNRWKLIVINPSFVLGPAINPYGTSESLNLIKQMGNGNFKSGVPDFSIGMVDVRDVAEAHFLAAFHPEASGRYVTSGHNSNFLAIAKILSNNFGNAYPFPKKALPKFLIMIFGPLTGLKVRMLKRNVGIPFKADNSKIRNELGLTFRPMEDSVIEVFQQMIDHKIIRLR
jgi:nucleoside-diphosphate-sugar epimerase